MHICLFGGAFDPPHIGHQKVALELLTQHICDEVWFVPVHQHPFGKKIETNGHRVTMLSMILGPKMRIERFELEQQGKNYSIGTLRTLSVKHPEHTFSWVIGSDNLPSFNKWNHYQEMIKEFKVYIYPRASFPFEPIYHNMTPLTGFEEVTVSSTDIREKVQKREPITRLVDKRVEEYIIREKLYKY